MNFSVTDDSLSHFFKAFALYLKHGSYGNSLEIHSYST